MSRTFESLAGLSLEWTGTHYSKQGDFPELSTHIVSYDTDSSCSITALGKLVGAARYCYEPMGVRMATLIYWPEVYQGRRGVVLYAMLDFDLMLDRAVIVHNDRPLAIANGSFRVVETPAKPAT
ncbi:hypothetical protein [Microbulbifer variabilis]|uniref:hypothetical protein n=1 Tax=Microbulbifer variabilis TaxID=266805 RepID=UPI001CFDF33C|nr:hypothetical protein [Microbulbifer variabilis]